MTYSGPKTAEQTSPGPLLDELRQLGAKVDKPKSIKCPWHDDKTASAGIYRADDLVWRFKCQVCDKPPADVYDLRAEREGRPLADVLRETHTPAAPPKPDKPPEVFPTIKAMATRFTLDGGPFIYAHPQTSEPEMIVIRYKTATGKKFVQCRPVSGGFIQKAPEKPWPIYNRRRIADSPRVIVVEGEKCVHVLHDLGIVATTSPGGAGNSKNADWTPMAGKTCYLWPDNDEAGVKHMQDVAEILNGLGCSVLYLDPSEIGVELKGDVADLVAGLPKDQAASLVESVLSESVPAGPSAAVNQTIEDAISGKISTIPMPWATLGNMSRATRSGTITVVCGSPGSCKSFLMLQAHLYWHAAGIKTALYEMEEDREYHLLRALALLDGNAGQQDLDWIKSHPDDAREAYQRHKATLDAFGQTITDAPDRAPTLKQLAEWVEVQCKAGKEIITIDPVTGAEVSEKPWQADHEFITRVKTASRQSGARVILVTHPRKSVSPKPGGMDDLAGGTAYARLTQTVLWIVSNLDEERKIRTALGECSMLVNREVRIIKARNGSGAGHVIGCYFDPFTLRLEERGLLISD